MTLSVIPADIQEYSLSPVFSKGCTNMVICFAGHGVVNKKKKRITVNVIKKSSFFIVPPFFCDIALSLPKKQGNSRENHPTGKII
jgi:hypothetical protein